MHTCSEYGFVEGKVSTGLMHATPGDIKSLSESMSKMALMFAVCERESAPLRRKFVVLELRRKMASRRSKISLSRKCCVLWLCCHEKRNWKIEEMYLR